MNHSRRKLLRSLSVAGTSVGIGSVLSGTAKGDRIKEFQWIQPSQEEIRKYAKKAWNDEELQRIREALQEKGCERTGKGRVRKLNDQGEAQEYYIVTFPLEASKNGAEASLRWVSSEDGMTLGEYFPNGTNIRDGKIEFTTYTVQGGTVVTNERTVNVPSQGSSRVKTESSCGFSTGVAGGAEFHCSCPCNDLSWDCIRETILGAGAGGAACTVVSGWCIALLLYSGDLLEDCCSSGWNCHMSY